MFSRGKIVPGSYDEGVFELEPLQTWQADKEARGK